MVILFTVVFILYLNMRTTGLFLWPVQAVGIDDFVFPITISFSTTVLLKAPTT